MSNDRVLIHDEDTSPQPETEAAPVLAPDVAADAVVFLNRATLHATEMERLQHIRAVLEAIARSGSK